MRRILASLGIMSLALPSAAHAAPPAVHALFVGIDQYAHSRQQDPRGNFNDLNGAVGDVRRMKKALREVYGLSLDEDAPAKCETANAVSVTLTNSCATRKNILSVLSRQIAAAGQGETVLLYFAGHGTNEEERITRNQAKQSNGTFVPYDARGATNPVSEIYDIEFKLFRERANARGVNFVMIFDSCHSGTIGRDGKPKGPDGLGTAREIPAARELGLVPPPPQDPGELAAEFQLPEPTPGVTPGYWVSLGAAEDGQLAMETKNTPEPAGAFTTALTQAMYANAKATWGDLIAEARVGVDAMGFKQQTPKAEADIHRSLWNGGSSVVLYSAKPQGRGAVLESGSLSGVTEGSVFDLFERESDVQEGLPPFVSARADKVSAFSAQLTFTKPPARAPGARLVAVERLHSWGAQRIAVGFKDPPANPADARQLETMLGALAYASREPPLQAFLAFVPGSRLIELRDAQGELVRKMGSYDAPAFARELDDVLGLMLRSRLLLGLRTPGVALQPVLCVKPSDFEARKCGSSGEAAITQVQSIPVGRATMFAVTVRNMAVEPRQIYVLAVSPDGLKVVPVIPAPGTENPPLNKGEVLQSDPFYFSKPGNWRFITIASRSTINTAALEQRGLTARDPARCSASTASRTMCAAGRGANDTTATAKADWTANVTEIKVTQGN